MGRNYKQITLAERCQITQVLPAGFKVREIAAALDRAPSTISRELKRNGSRTKGYDPCYAQQRRAFAEAPQPDKYGKAAVFLASDDSEMITGFDLRVDAGAISRYWIWSPGDA